jgi:predicted O-methyltransferase YrrM
VTAADIMKIDGQTTEREGENLCLMARQVPAEQGIVEVGVYRGRSLCCLAWGAPPNVPVYGIDVWLSAEDMVYAGRALKQLNLEHRAILWPTESSKAARTWGGRVGLLHLDAAHDAASVNEEIEEWLPHCAPGATIMVHDYGATFPGVVWAVERARKVRTWESFTVRGTHAMLRVPR